MSELWQWKLDSTQRAIDDSRRELLEKLDRLAGGISTKAETSGIVVVPKGLEHKDLFARFERTFYTKDVNSGGEFEALGSTWETDLEGDRIVPGAFADSIRRSGGKVPMLMGHDRNRIIGLAEDLQETRAGLAFRGRLARTQQAQEIRELLKLGAVHSFSIGFTIPDGGARIKGGGREITRVMLHEISTVVFPANPGARLSTVKGGWM